MRDGTSRGWTASLPEHRVAPFHIEKVGWRRAARLVASELLTPADFDEAASALGAAPQRARKVNLVAACRASAPTLVETKWGGEDTRNTAEIGDWIVTAMTRDGKPLQDAKNNVNRYVIKDARFAELYERAVGETADGPLFRPRGVVDALYLPGGFDILAPWGERQTSTTGYLLRNGQEIYGNERSAFEQTYQIIG